MRTERRRAPRALWTRFRNPPPLLAARAERGGRQAAPIARSLLAGAAPAWRLFSPGVRTGRAGPRCASLLPSPGRARSRGPEGAGSAEPRGKLRADAAGAGSQPRRVGPAPAGGGWGAGVSRELESRNRLRVPGRLPSRAPPPLPVGARAPNFGGRGADTQAGKGNFQLGKSSTQAPTVSTPAAPRPTTASYSQLIVTQPTDTARAL